MLRQRCITLRLSIKIIAFLFVVASFIINQLKMLSIEDVLIGILTHMYISWDLNFSQNPTLKHIFTWTSEIWLMI